MEPIATLIAFFAMMLAFCAGFFLLVVQPIWSIVDVVGSPRLSTGVKVTLIVLTLVLLGPILTFFYGLFGTDSRGLRRSTLVGTGLFAVAVAGVFGLAAIGAATAGPTDMLPGGTTTGATSGEVDLAAVEEPALP